MARLLVKLSRGTAARTDAAHPLSCSKYVSQACHSCKRSHVACRYPPANRAASPYTASPYTARARLAPASVPTILRRQRERELLCLPARIACSLLLILGPRPAKPLVSPSVPVPVHSCARPVPQRLASLLV